ncbi:hypothetical protein EMIT013CA1_80195 [Bacillus sp. IT-13CA1]
MSKAIIFGPSWTTGHGRTPIKTATDLYLSTLTKTANERLKKADTGLRKLPRTTVFKKGLGLKDGQLGHLFISALKPI